MVVGLEAAPGLENGCPSLPPPLPVHTPVHALHAGIPRQTFLHE